MCFVESHLCPFRYSRIIHKGNALFPLQKMAQLLEKNPPVRMNRAIFISFYLERRVMGGWKRTFLLKSWEYCLRDSWSVCFNASRSHLLHHRRNPCSTAFPCRDTGPGLSSALYPTCQVRELNMSILLHLEEEKKKKNGRKSWRGILFFFIFSFFLHTVL